MESQKEIIERFRKQLIGDLLAESNKSNSGLNRAQITSLWLAPIDYHQEYSAKKKILEELKIKGVIVGYKIKTQIMKFEPQKITPLQRELYPEETYEYENNSISPEEKFTVAEIAYYPLQLKAKLRKFSSLPTRIIRDIKIGKNCLIINEKEVVNFKSIQQDNEKQTKMFKILSTLFRYNRVVKHNRPIGQKKLVSPNYLRSVVSLEILKEKSLSPTIKAVIQNIKRLNERFVEEQLPIEICTSEKNGRTTMIIRKEV